MDIRYSWHKIIPLAVSLSAISFYIRDFLQLISFAVLPTMTVEVIMIMLMFRLPLLFSFLVCFVGNLAISIFEGLYISIGTSLGVTSEELIQTSLPHVISLQLVTALLLMCCVAFLQRTKIGFHITTSDALKGYNFLLSAFLIISVAIMQAELISFEVLSLHFFIPVILCLVFLVTLYLSYRRNKRLWKQRRERLAKK
ncbi:hypothetical protein [Paenibacillus thalictri]|nr:hypothetical protein [Paenibacillus thalictri]